MDPRGYLQPLPSSDFRRLSFGDIVQSKSTYARSMGGLNFVWDFSDGSCHQRGTGLFTRETFEFLGLARLVIYTLERLPVDSKKLVNCIWSYNSLLE